MKLVIFGLTLSSSWGNGHATLWRGLIRALARNGHEVVFFERDVPYYAAHRDLNELPGAQLILYDGWHSVLERARQQVCDADVLLVTSYCPDAITAARLIFDQALRERRGVNRWSQARSSCARFWPSIVPLRLRDAKGRLSRGRPGACGLAHQRMGPDGRRAAPSASTPRRTVPRDASMICTWKRTESPSR